MASIDSDWELLENPWDVPQEASTEAASGTKHLYHANHVDPRPLDEHVDSGFYINDLVEPESFEDPTTHPRETWGEIQATDIANFSSSSIKIIDADGSTDRHGRESELPTRSNEPVVGATGGDQAKTPIFNAIPEDIWILKQEISSEKAVWATLTVVEDLVTQENCITTSSREQPLEFRTMQKEKWRTSQEESSYTNHSVSISESPELSPQSGSLSVPLAEDVLSHLMVPDTGLPISIRPSIQEKTTSERKYHPRGDMYMLPIGTSAQPRCQHFNSEHKRPSTQTRVASQQASVSGLRFDLPPDMVKSLKPLSRHYEYDHQCRFKESSWGEGEPQGRTRKTQKKQRRQYVDAVAGHLAEQSHKSQSNAVPRGERVAPI